MINNYFRNFLGMDYDFIRGIHEPIQNQIFQIMKDKVNREKAFDEIVKIIQNFQ